VRRLEFGIEGRSAALERIELRPAVAQEAVGIDHLQHLDLLAVGTGGAGACSVPSLARCAKEAITG
jgi:tRNA A37 threonylcarbamoyladenosine dehydratase